MRDLKAVLDRQQAWRSEAGDYAEYMDDRFPEAGVVIRRKNGQMVAIIDTPLWDEARTPRKTSSAV